MQLRLILANCIMKLTNMECEKVTMESNAAVVSEHKLNSNDICLRNTFEKDELIACAQGELFGAGNAQLPLPPLLMFDRISDIQTNSGDYGRGLITAELDINPFLWFFKSHFHGDPLMPGCLAIEALWQLSGFYLGWSGYQGRGRIIDSGSTRFTREVTPANKLVRFDVHIKRVLSRGDVIAIADGRLHVDGEIACTTKNLKIGLFR